MTYKNVAIILPAYNEEKTIALTLEDFYRVAPEAHFVVVDNASQDRTSEIANETMQKLGCQGVVLFESRKGKANALRKALYKTNAEIFIMADADYTYAADDLPSLMKALMDHDADLVVGNRHADRVYREQNHRMFHDFGNNLVRKLINFLFRSRLQDIMSGYRVMTKRFVRHFPILSEGFEIETEMTLQAVDKKFKLVEVPIQYRKRPEGSESKLNTFKDGFRILKLIFWIFKDYRPLLFFSALSLVFAAASLAVGVPVIVEFLRTGLVPKFPSAILASGLAIISIVFFAIGILLDTVAKFHREQYELKLMTDDQGKSDVR